MNRLRFFLPLCLIIGLAYGQATIDPSRITIHRDRWGVPHIEAPTDAEAAYGFAWAQCEDDFRTIQLTLLPLRGRLSEVQGPSGAVMDVAAAMLGLDTLVEQRYASDLSPEFRRVVEGFAAGVNAYAQAHPEALLLKGMLPFTPQEIIQGYVFQGAFLTGLETPLSDILGNRLPLEQPRAQGSNAFAFSPTKTTDGRTYFCSNSHQPLQGPYSWYEAHVYSEEGWNFLGATFPGGVTPFVGTNEHLGWTHTVNHPDFVDVYQLSIDPEDELRYRYDGEWRQLQQESIKLKVKVGPFKLPVKRTFYRSVYGLTLKTEQGTFALRFPANQDIRAAEQWWRMNKARNWSEYEQALRMLAIPGTNIVYADRAGNIYYVGYGRIPLREGDFDWEGVLPGDTSATRWEALVPFEQLAQVRNPSGGYVFNSNHSPYLSMAAQDAPDPDTLAPYLGYRVRHNNRSNRFFTLIDSLETVSWGDLLRIKYDIAYEPFVPHPVVTNWRDLWALSPATYPDLTAMLILLHNWDFRCDTASEGATVFLLCWREMYQRLSPQGLWRTGYEASEAELVASLRAVDAYLRGTYGRPNVALGEMQRHRRGEVDLPVAGGPDVLAAMYASPDEDGRFASQVGDGFIQFVKYGPEGPELIETIVPYGSSARPDSPHYTDQMQQYVRQERKVMTLDMEQVRTQARRSYSPQ